MEPLNRAAVRRFLAIFLGLGMVIGAALPAAVDEPPIDPPPAAAGGPAAPAGSAPPSAPATAGDAAASPEASAPGEPVRKRAGRIRGTVTDPEKKALPGLLVTLSSRSESDILRVTGTNEKGQYVFQELPPGLYDLKVQAEGFLDAGKESIDIRPPFQNIVDVRMQRPVQGQQAATGASPGTPGGAGPVSGALEPEPVTVRGRFVDQDRRPLVEVSVLLASLQGKGIHQAFSGDDGMIEIPGVVPGRYRVIVRSPGHVPLDLRSVEILGKLGLTVSLMLVDYPLNFKAGQESATPIEEPRAAPAATQGGTPAPENAAADRPGGG